MCVEPPFLERPFGNARVISKGSEFPEYLWREVLSRGHALFPVCRTEACVRCRALLFCQRPVCLASGALCAHLLGAIDTSSVLENSTSSTCPDAAVRFRFAGELTGSTPSPQFLWIHFPLPAPQRIAGNREASRR